MTAHTYTVQTQNAEESAVDCLAAASGVSKLKIKDAMAKGAVWVTQQKKQTRLRRATKTFKTGTLLTFHYDPAILALEPKAPECLYRVKDYSVWYKPSGLHTQGTQWGDHCSLLRWVEKITGEAFLIHRLDADASGLVMVAHNSKAASQLSALFQGREIEKYYEAWVDGYWAIPPEGLTITASLDEKPCETLILAGNLAEKATRLNIQLKTGRKHQIRRHLAQASHPILGDKLYGKPHKLPLQLCAYRLRLLCPTSQQPLDILLDETKRLATTL